MAHVDNDFEEKKVNIDIYNKIERLAKNNPNFKQMSISFYKLSIPYFRDFANALKFNHILTYLTITNIFNFCDKMVYSLSDALKINTTLKHLELSSNNLGSQCGIIIADALHENHTLTELYLRRNSLGDIGGAAIAQLLKNNNTILSLDISNNKLGVICGLALAEALKINNGLSKLQIYNNKIGSLAGIAIAEALKVNNRTLTDLTFSISNCDNCDKPLYGDDDVILAVADDSGGAAIRTAFFEMLKHNQVIIKMILYFPKPPPPVNYVYNSDDDSDHYYSDEEELFNNLLKKNSTRVWSSLGHSSFSPIFHTNIFCILLSANRFLPNLPEEIWRQYILPYFRYDDYDIKIKKQTHSIFGSGDWGI